MVGSLTHPVAVRVTRMAWTLSSGGREFAPCSERCLRTIRIKDCTMSEQKRIARELDQRVAERTRELVEANEALKRELVVERQRTEARSASDQDSRAIVRSSPGMVAILTRSGGIDTINDELVEYSG